MIAHFTFELQNQTILKCSYLVGNKIHIHNKFKRSFQRDCAPYEDTNIHKEAIEKIQECSQRIYVLELGIDYYDQHLNMAKYTLSLLEAEQRRTYTYHRLLLALVYKLK